MASGIVESWEPGFRSVSSVRPGAGVGDWLALMSDSSPASLASTLSNDLAPPGDPRAAVAARNTPPSPPPESPPATESPPVPSRGLPAWLRRHWSLLLPAFVYLYVFPYLPQLRSPNELSRLLQSRALIDHHSLEIGEELRTQGPVGDLSCVAVARGANGAIRDRIACPQTRGNPLYNEQHTFPSKAPLLAFAAAPVYAALKFAHGDVPEFALVFFARLVCLVLPSLLLLVLLRRYLGTLVTKPLNDVLTLAYAFGTLAFSYSEQFVSHQVTAVLAFSCFYVLWRLRRNEWPAWGYVVAGFLAGLTVTAEYTGVLALIPLGGYAMTTVPGGWSGRWRATLYALLGLLPPVLALATYHQVAFGHPLTSGYRFLNDVGYQSWHQGGFLGIKLPNASALVQSFFSPLRGLFTLSPMLLLALPRLFDPRSLRRNPELWLSLATLLLYAYFTSSFSYASWGWTTGPRHLTPLVPFLLLPLALFLRSLGESPRPGRESGAWGQVLAAGVAVALVVLSMLTTSVMTLLNYISDTFTNALYQVALPLALRGFLPHTWLSLLGVPNPWAALPAMACLAAAVGACAIILLRSIPSRRRLPALAVALVIGSAIATAHASLRPRGHERVVRERQAAVFMENVYQPRPHQRPPGLWTH